MLPGPDASGPKTAEDAAPALTLVFVREGWGPALFRRLARRRFLHNPRGGAYADLLLLELCVERQRVPEGNVSAWRM
ncbi:MAG: hypothetical protein OXJ64_08115 [Boseongicola sp.]|nr:hypothetical protein [Boseongicola sp.]